MTTTATPTVKNHIDGGTYTVIAFAETRNHWGIAITRWTTYRGEVLFEVKRVSPDNWMVRTGQFDTEPEARKFANDMWRLDR